MKMSAKLKFITAVLLLSLLSVSIFASSDSESVAQRKSFIEGARKFLGTPYVYGGTSKKGIDCSGLIYLAAKEGLGLEIPRTAALLAEYCRTISAESRQPGDLMFFSENGRTVSHVSIYIGDGQMIHAASDGPNTGVIISKITENYWKTHYFCSGRFLNEVKDESLFNATGSQTPSQIQPQLPSATTITTQQEKPAAQTSSTSSSASATPAQSQSGSTGTTSGSTSSASPSGISSTQKENDYVYTPGYHSNASDYSGAGYYDDFEHRDAFNDYSNYGTTTSSSFIQPEVPSYAFRMSADFSAEGSYNLFNSDSLSFYFRGVSLKAFFNVGNDMFKGGLGVGLSYDPAVNAVQIPLLLSFQVTPYFRVYGGPVITFGTPVLPGTDTEIKAPFFPGIIGFTAQTPSLRVGGVNVQLYQDVYYNVFNDKDGSALSLLQSIGAGLKLSTGIRVTIPEL